MAKQKEELKQTVHVRYKHGEIPKVILYVDESLESRRIKATFDEMGIPYELMPVGPARRSPGEILPALHIPSERHTYEGAINIGAYFLSRFES